MDLTENKSNHPNLITIAQANQCTIGSESYNHSIIIPYDGDVSKCDVNSVAGLNEQLISQLCKYNPEVIILATGENIEFPKTDLLTPLVKQHIGLEVLNNQAAARTFNVLLAENRKAVCLMLIKP